MAQAQARGGDADPSRHSTHPILSDLERLFEVKGTAPPPHDQDLVRALLSICSRRQEQQKASEGEWKQSLRRLTARRSARGLGGAPAAGVRPSDASLCADMVRLVRGERGVVLSLALHALHTWGQSSPERLLAAVEGGAVPAALRALCRAMAAPRAGAVDAYTTSAAALLLRSLTRAGEPGMRAFLAAGGPTALVRATRGALGRGDDRALCLGLYVLNDVTRRSADALRVAVGAGAVPVVVGVLELPLSEATKFAALLLNRWSLLSTMAATVAEEGAGPRLLGVLLRRHAAAGSSAAAGCCMPGCGCALGGRKSQRSAGAEAAAYALSALSIMGQHMLGDVRALVLTQESGLECVTTAMADYERAFPGAGFPHALLSGMLAGDGGCGLAAGVVRRGLAPAWARLRHVACRLAERVAQPDVLRTLDALPDVQQGTVALGLAHLLPRASASLGAALGAALRRRARLPALVRAAVDEALRPEREADFSAGLAGGAQATAAPVESPAGAPRGCRRCTAAMLGSALALAAGAAPSLGAAAALHPDSTLADAVELESRPSDASSCATDAAAGDLPAALLHSPSMDLPSASPKVADALSEGAEELPLPLLLYTPAGEEAADGDALAGLACLSAWLDAAAAAAGEPGPSGRGAKRPLDSAEAGGAAKRGRWGVFSRDQVNVPRYDTLTFSVAGRDFHAVGFVLEAHSPLLASLLSTLRGIDQRLELPCPANLPADALYRLFGLAVEHCYTGDVEGLGPGEALSLWALAEFLQMDGVQRHCEAVVAAGLAGAGAGAPLARRALELGLQFPAGGELVRAVAGHVLQRLSAADAGPGVLALAAAHTAPLAATMAAVLEGRLEQACGAAAAGAPEAARQELDRA